MYMTIFVVPLFSILWTVLVESCHTKQHNLHELHVKLIKAFLI